MKKKDKSKIKENIPVEIKVLFGKFTFFSIIIILLLAVVYPFIVLNYFSIYSQIGLLVFVVLFYGYMIFNLIRKKKNFMSMLVPILIALVVLVLILDIIKLIGVNNI